MVIRLILLLALSVLPSFKLLAEQPLTLFTYHYPPLVEASDPDNINGSAWNVVKELLEKSQTEYQVVVKPVMRGFSTVVHNKNSCVFPVDRTQERESMFSWVGPIAINQYAFYSAPDKKIPLINLSDASDYNIATYLGGSIGNYLEKNGFSVRLTREMKQGLLMLKHGRVDLWVVNVNAAKRLSEQYGFKLGKPELVFFTSINYMACHPDISESKLEKIDRALEEMYISGDVQQFLEIDL